MFPAFPIDCRDVCKSLIRVPPRAGVGNPSGESPGGHRDAHCGVADGFDELRRRGVGKNSSQQLCAMSDTATPSAEICFCLRGGFIYHMEPNLLHIGLECSMPWWSDGHDGFCDFDGKMSAPRYGGWSWLLEPICAALTAKKFKACPNATCCLKTATSLHSAFATFWTRAGNLSNMILPAVQVHLHFKQHGFIFRLHWVERGVTRRSWGFSGVRTRSFSVSRCTHASKLC